MRGRLPYAVELISVVNSGKVSSAKSCLARPKYNDDVEVDDEVDACPPLVLVLLLLLLPVPYFFKPMKRFTSCAKLRCDSTNFPCMTARTVWTMAWASTSMRRSMGRSLRQRNAEESIAWMGTTREQERESEREGDEEGEGGTVLGINHERQKHPLIIRINTNIFLNFHILPSSTEYDKNQCNPRDYHHVVLRVHTNKEMRPSLGVLVSHNHKLIRISQ